MVNGFVSAIFIKTINCVGEPLDRHLNTQRYIDLSVHQYLICSIDTHIESS